MRHVRPLEDAWERPQQRRLREIADDGHVEQPVVHRRVRRDVHAPRVGGSVADRDQPRLELVDLAVDGEPVRAGFVDRQRADGRGDVERGAGDPLHRVRPAVRLRVEPGRGHARVPAAVHAAEIDHLVDAVRQRVERRERVLLGVVAELPGEVVARAGRHDRQPRAGVGRDRRDSRRRRRHRRTQPGRAPTPPLPSPGGQVHPDRARPRPRRRPPSPRASARRAASGSARAPRPD